MREMKDSGIDIVKEIPSNWSIIRLKYLCDIQTGNQDTQDADEDGEYNFYVRSPIIEKSTRYTFNGEGILMAGDGAGAGRIFHHAFGKYAVHQRVYRLSNFKQINSYYLFYYLSNLFSVEMDKGSAQSTVPSVRLPMLLNFGICIPPSDEQNRISDYLENKCNELQTLISDIQNEIETLEEYKRSVITEAVTKGLDPYVEMKKSDVPFIDSIPISWTTIKTGYLFRENVRQSDENDVPLSLSQVDGLIATDDMKESSLKAANYDGWKRVKLNDLVLNRFKAHLGVLFAATIEGKVSFHYGVYERTRPLIPKYYEYLFHTHYYKAILGSMSNGMTVGLQNLSNQNFYSVKSLFPPLHEQEEIVSFLDKKCNEIDLAIAEKKQQIETIEEYKKSLIFEYVTGKKEV